MGLSVLCFAFKYDPVLGCIDPVDYWNYNPRLIAWPTHLVVFFYSWNFLSHWLSQGSSTRTLPSSRKEDKFNVGSRTKIFMAIGALIGEQHSFMHDLKSFFWVLFWICVHWNGLGEKRSESDFEDWNYLSTEKLARQKAGQVSKGIFNTVDNKVTTYCKPLVPCVVELHTVYFPEGTRRLEPDRVLHTQMKSVLEKAGGDLAALATV